MAKQRELPDRGGSFRREGGKLVPNDSKPSKTSKGEKSKTSSKSKTTKE